MAGYRRGLRLPGSVVVVAGAAGRSAGPSRRRWRAGAAGAAGRASASWTGGRRCGARRSRRPRRRRRRARAARRPSSGTAGSTGGCTVADARTAPAASWSCRWTRSARARRRRAGRRARRPGGAAAHGRAGGGVLVVVASLHGQVAGPYGAAQGMAAAAVRVLAGRPAPGAAARRGARRRGDGRCSPRTAATGRSRRQRRSGWRRPWCASCGARGWRRWRAVRWRRPWCTGTRSCRRLTEWLVAAVRAYRPPQGDSATPYGG